MDKPIRIKLMADYQCWPLWYAGDDPEQIGCIDPNRLPLSTELKTRLMKWQDSFDRRLNLSDPKDHENKPPISQGEVQWFKEESVRLAEALQKELGPGYEIIRFEH